ncbi:MAG: PAS domain S-box protein [Nitrospirae bacterium]|nr:PAS domain S-box protein [Nitrospirota bacterium]
MKLPGRTDSDRQDAAFLVLRILAFGGGLVFVLSAREHFQAIRIIGFLFGLFAAASVALYLLAWPLLGEKRHFYFVAGWIDLAFLAVLIHLTDGFRSDFVPALYLFCAFHSYYFGRREGSVFALGAAAALIFFLLEASRVGAGPTWFDAILPVGIIGTLSFLMGNLSDHDRALLREVEQQHTETAKRWYTSEGMIDQLIELLPDAVGCTDAERRPTRVNQKMLDLTGYTKEEILGMSMADIVAPDAMKSNVEAHTRVREKGFSSHETAVITKDGRRIPMEVSAIAIRDPHGKFLSTLALCRDISARKDAEQRGMAMTERLSAVGLLASGVAHEINNPLSGLMNALKALEQDDLKPERRERYMRIMRECLERMADTVRGLLRFSRPDNLHPTEVGLPALVDDCLDLLSPTMKAKAIRSRKLWAPTPGGPDGFLVLADRGQLRQACMNVLLNAIHAVPSGGMVEVNFAHQENRIGIQIADNGPGVPKEIRERVFEPFFTTKPEGEGTGLGLSVTLGIVKAHGGYIEIGDRLGGGASITLWLPTGKPDPAGDVTKS